MRLFSEARCMDVRYPNLNRPQTLPSQPLPVGSYLVA